MRVRDYVDDIRIEDGFLYRNCLLFPVSVEKEVAFPGLTLDEAVEKGIARIEELPHSTIDRVRITNTADSPIFLMDGEMLIEALQTRVVNTSLIVDREQRVEIPVSCVEEGRWAGSTSFKAGRTCATPSVRRDVITSMVRTRSFRSDQNRVWSTVSTTLTTFRVHSRTSSLYNLFTSPAVSHFLPEEEEVKDLYNFNGILCAVDGEMFFDIFSSKEIFQKMVRKLVGSYVIEAIGKKGNIKAKKVDAEKFVNHLINTEGEKMNSPTGIGFEIRVSTKEGIGKSLIYENTAIHFNGFSVKN